MMFDEISVTVLTEDVYCVTVAQGGVEYWVEVDVTVGILSKELQYGLTTRCCFISVTIGLTALQLTARSSKSEAATARENNAVRRRRAML